MVVGNGLLAKAFGRYAGDESKIIFASGVSNSRQTAATEFEREKKLLASNAPVNAQLVYFSTVSVHDQSLTDSSYVQHKKQMEEFIAREFSSFIIFRLPILVGRTDNTHTLTNFLYHKISNGEQVQVFKNACRYIMDVDDVSFLLGKMIDSKRFDRQTLDINFDNAIYLDELVTIFEMTLGQIAKKEILEKGSCYTTGNAEFLAFMNTIDYHLPLDYTQKVIAKYYRDKK